ncbi:hypothetical protein [Hyalangium gracile]|uniref:hypothetical protein n=1 Tax=Hyalangium gracile TaxID=394092 RepID=UPI001CCFE225|nr:hypothetical protein [Hyalangium gracile]
MKNPSRRVHPSLVILGLLLSTGVSRAEPPSPQTPEAATPASASAAPAEEQPPILTSLYPLWENTGRVLPHKGLYLGTSNAEFGLFGVAQLGVHPLSFVFRAPNIHAKLRLLATERLAVAAHAEVLVFLPGSGEAFTSSNYISRLDTRDILLTVVPVGTTASYQVFPWLYLHGTATVMGMFDNGPYRNRLVVGTNLVAEFLAFKHHSVRAHASEVGFWDHDFNMLGASYCYRRGWFEAQVGYFYRFFEDGRQTSPLLALGIYL